MADRSRAMLIELLSKPGNNVCADCRSPDPEWVEVNLGMFLCPDCAGCHRQLGTHISRVRSIKLDNWEEDQVQEIAEKGNEVVNKKYEEFLPPYFKRPTKEDPELLRLEFVKAKYARKEFMDPEKQKAYCDGIKEGYLHKRGKDDNGFKKRKFILSSKVNGRSLSYFVKDTNSSPKHEIDLESVNVVFAKDKITYPNGLQITYFYNGLTRSIFVYASDSKEIVDWYYAIRAAKFHWRKIAHPMLSDEELVEGLTNDFRLEGWLHKKGPRPSDSFKKRWFTLDNRKLMYSEDPLSPFPKNEVYIGHQDEGGYSISMGSGSNSDVRNSMGYVFTLTVPGRDFVLSANLRQDMDQWIEAFKEIMSKEPTSQDLRLKRLMSKNS